MRWRAGFAGALAGSAGLALLLMLVCHPAFALGSSSGMSAPPPPARSVESIPAAHYLTPQFDAQVAAVSSAFTPTVAAACTAPGAHPDSGAVPPHYGPLHRRPPPSFS